MLANTFALRVRTLIQQHEKPLHTSLRIIRIAVGPPGFEPGISAVPIGDDVAEQLLTLSSPRKSEPFSSEMKKFVADHFSQKERRDVSLNTPS